MQTPKQTNNPTIVEDQAKASEPEPLRMTERSTAVGPPSDEARRIFGQRLAAAVRR